MWAYVLRKLLFNIPVYLGIILLVMLALRVHDPVDSFLGKNPSPGEREAMLESTGLNRPFLVQYVDFLLETVTTPLEILRDAITDLFSAEDDTAGDTAGTASDTEVETKKNATYSWIYTGREVGEMLRSAILPSLYLTIPALILTSLISIGLGLVSSFNRGRVLDRSLVFAAVLGMCVSFLVYIIVGQYVGAFKLSEWAGREIFATGDYSLDLREWPRYYLLPVMISVIVAMGYDTRFYRAVMVEECTRDYITTAEAKGATRNKIMFVHMLKNALIPIITRIMITLPFLVTGSILLEMFFRIPGMGYTLIRAVGDKDFPVVQAFTAMFAALFIATNILTDILYALVDPRIRLS